MAECRSHEEFGECDEEMRVVALGKNGSGKSATGNNFLGVWIFLSICSAKSVTENCQFHSVLRFGKKLVFVDTPGLFDIDKPNEIIQKEIIKCIALSSPGPHVFLLIIKVDRFTPEEKETITLFEKVFGDEFYNHLIVVFTHKDLLDKSGKSLQQFISEAPADLKKVLRRNNNICIAIENEAPPNEIEKQMKDLFDLATVVVGLNRGKHYTNTTFENMEKRLLKKEDEQRKSHMDKMTKTINDKTRGVEKKSKDIAQEEDLQRALVCSFNSNTEISSTEAQLVEANINRLVKEKEHMKYEIIRMEEEIRRNKQEAKKCPQKPGCFRENVRKMIESEEGQLIANFLKEYGPTILKWGIGALIACLKK